MLSSTRWVVALETALLGLIFFAFAFRFRATGMHEDPQATGVAIGALLGFVARACRGNVLITRAGSVLIAMCCLGLTVRCVHGSWDPILTYPDPIGGVLIVTSFVAPAAIVLLGLRLGPHAIPVAIGAALVGLTRHWHIAHAPLLAALVFTSIRDLGVRAKPDGPRTRLALIGLGALATLAWTGVLHDLIGLSLALREGEAAWFWVRDYDGPALAVRLGMGASVLLGAVVMARGKTAGWLILALVGPAWVTVLVWQVIAGTMLHWGSGCFSHHHPLAELQGLILILGAVACALVPWLGPMWRANVARAAVAKWDPVN